MSHALDPDKAGARATGCTNQTAPLSPQPCGSSWRSYTSTYDETHDALLYHPSDNERFEHVDDDYCSGRIASSYSVLCFPVANPTALHINFPESQDPTSHTQRCQTQGVVLVRPEDLELQATNEYSPILPAAATTHVPACISPTWIHAELKDLVPYRNAWSGQPGKPNTSDGPTTHEHKPRQQRNEALKQWLHCNSAVPYPTLERMQEFATAENKTLRQVQVAFSNLRARMRRSRTEGDALEMSPNKVPLTASETRIDDDEECTLDFDWSWLDLETYGLDLSSPPPISAQTIELSVAEQDAYHTALTPSSVPHSHHSSPSSQGYDMSSPRDLTRKSRKGKKRFAARTAPILKHNTEPVIEAQPFKRPINRFFCTACSNAGPFKTYFDWKRHEEGKHWYIEAKYTCMPNSEWTRAGRCVFCSYIIDDDNHFLLHNISGCLKKCEADRTFARKDLFKQHIKNMHLATADKREQDAFQIPDAWVEDVQSFDVDHAALWCGFCRKSFGRVADRMKHVALHFQDGCDVNTWVPSNLE
ncbi:hypothetical protein FB567DRAFT_548179 [Paraphoma chrysanthemicola]|uniref:Homeobox domain-containing protein n=1 Tax=Paraphoma chrysanthemicola TaxID=798071 RepID=A0A8K0R798_9PLEO|nr:hypothetical protein FB567DRAFT_548179 [Paraphoma chrysanthemicola]